MSESRSSRTIGVVTAMPEELDAILARGCDARRERGGTIRARFGPANVLLAPAGDGAVKARRRAGELCDARVDALVGAGIAGALAAELSAGELVVGRCIRDASGEAPAPDPAMLSHALSADGVTSGTLLTVDRPLVSLKDKATLAGSGDCGAAAADMESAAWARAAAERGIPYLVIRAIGDEAGEELPRYLPECMDREGGLRRSAVVARALANPWTIPDLMRLRRRVLDVAQRLALFVEWVIKGIA
jgi:adenosylhomocysteine nucleosidase